MTDSKSFLSQIAETASFAFREYFRPLVAVNSFVRSKFAAAGAKAPQRAEQDTVEAAKRLESQSDRIGVD